MNLAAPTPPPPTPFSPAMLPSKSDMIDSPLKMKKKREKEKKKHFTVLFFVNLHVEKEV